MEANSFFGNRTAISLKDEEKITIPVWATIDSILILATLAGNILTICAIKISRKLSAMISSQFILSLALSDLMVGLTIPYHFAFNIYDENSLRVNKNTCILKFVLTCLACSSSIYNLLATATDRYIAIVHPFEYGKYMTRKMAIFIILLGWFVAFALSTIPIYWNELDKNHDHKCAFSVLPTEYVNWVLMPMFSLVWIAMLLVYWRIGREATGHAKRLRNTTNHNGHGINDTKSIQVVLLILGCFSVCWLPYFVMVTFMKNQALKPVIYETVFTLAVANSVMNPIIYAWKNTNFRQAFWCLLRCKSPNVFNHKTSFITNHVPGSKKNSMNCAGNGICNGTEQELTRSELNMEMQCPKIVKNCKHSVIEYTDLTINTKASSTLSRSSII